MRVLSCRRMHLLAGCWFTVANGDGHHSILIYLYEWMRTHSGRGISRSRAVGAIGHATLERLCVAPVYYAGAHEEGPDSGCASYRTALGIRTECSGQQCFGRQCFGWETPRRRRAAAVAGLCCWVSPAWAAVALRAVYVQSAVSGQWWSRILVVQRAGNQTAS